MTNKVTKATPRKEIEMLELQIKLNEMIPPHMQCKDSIADMKSKLAHLRRQGELRAVT